MRSLPQHHPVHRFTLDRHLVQAAYEATAYAREVDRPDLLLIGAFLHDVGKGLAGDHSMRRRPDRGRDRDPDRPAAGRRRHRSRSWSGCTCCCPTWRPGAT